MKTLALFFIFLAATFSASAELTIEDVSPHFSTNAEIVWQAPMNQLPKSFWIYKIMPRVFSETTISNAIVLASFQDKGFPKPSTNRVVIWTKGFDGEMEPPYFSILPDVGQMSFALGDRASDSPEVIWTNQAAVDHAWNVLFQLGVDPSQFIKTNTAASWGISFPRQVDGIQFQNDSEGFAIQQFGKDGKIRNFCLTWPNLERDQQSQTATPQQIITCIRAFKTPVAPNDDESDYFSRVKNLAEAKKLTITKITPYYGEGIYGETPTNGDWPKTVMPIVKLEAIADFGGSNTVVRFFSPIISSDVSRLLRNKK